VRIRKAASIARTLTDSHALDVIEIALQLVHGEFESPLGSVSSDMEPPRFGIHARDIRKMPPNKETIVRRDDFVEAFNRRFVIRRPEGSLDERLLAGQPVADRGIDGSLRQFRVRPARHQSRIGKRDATRYRA